ncbi:hypothetical protein F4810DRAFT_666812 [Camillea tinctor]|nr:hypothetical protein F4810DRAFT_666812 [Camillea tinctor]
MTNLGEWGYLVKRADGWYLPVLNTKNFLSHVAITQGYIQPQKLACAGRSGWTQLLYALGLVPESDHIFWQAQQAEFDPFNSDKIRLLVEGEALYHILNLYREHESMDSRNSKNIQNAWESRSKLSFGGLDLRRGDSGVVSAMLTSYQDLSVAKTVFEYNTHCISSDLRPGKDMAVFAYEVTIEHGISNLAAAKASKGLNSRYKWSSPN